jgi:hypothetical protein
LKDVSATLVEYDEESFSGTGSTGSKTYYEDDDGEEIQTFYLDF